MMNARMTDDQRSQAGTRFAARVILLDRSQRILLLHARSDHEALFWLMPGGGLEDGESFAEAAHREAREETGLNVNLGPCVWTRRHVFDWREQRIDQLERFFIGTTDQTDVQPIRSDDYVVGHRWWSLSELVASVEEFAPRKLGLLLPALLRGEYPEQPINCGV